MRTVITREQSTLPVLYSCTVRPLRGSVSQNLNLGQDTRANRTRHTTSSSTQPPPRASAPARGTIACASSTDLSASASGGSGWSVA